MSRYEKSPEIPGLFLLMLLQKLQRSEHAADDGDDEEDLTDDNGEEPGLMQHSVFVNVGELVADEGDGKAESQKKQGDSEILHDSILTGICFLLVTGTLRKSKGCEKLQPVFLLVKECSCSGDFPCVLQNDDDKKAREKSRTQ